MKRMQPFRYLFRKKWAMTRVLLVCIVAVTSFGFAFASQPPGVARATSALLQVSPTASTYPRQIRVTGSNYGATEKVQIYWNYTGPGTGMLEKTATANSTGAFTVLFYVPLTSTGSYTIAGVGMTSGMLACVPFQLLPSMPVTPVAGIAGAPVTLTGNALGVGENVNIYWNYSSTAGPVGMGVNVSGQGYAPGETVNILWNYTGPGTGTTVAQITAGVAGAFVSSFTVPTATVSSYAVAVLGTTSNLISQNTFSVLNGLTANPASASPGTSVTIAGMGFNANESVAINLDSSNGPLLATATATANGNLSQAVTIPSSTIPGSHVVVGLGLTSQISFNGTITVNTNWGAFEFDYAHSRMNSYENSISSANVSSLTLKWSANLGTGFWSSPVYANGIVYQASSRGILNAYNAKSGALIWQYNTNTEVSAPLVDPITNTVFYGTITQLISSATNVGLPSPVYGLNAQTGALKWSVIIPDDEYGFPTLAYNTIYVGSATEAHPGDVLAFDLLSGNLKWDYHTHSTWGSIAVDTSKGTVLTGNANPNAQVLALNAQTGQLVWQYNVPNSPNDTDVGAGIAVANGLVYANSKIGKVYAINENNGTTAWSTTVALHLDFSDVSSPALSTANVLYVGSTDQQLYALNAATGVVLWKTAVSVSISSSPALVNGVVYFASEDNSIYALDATAGTILWSFATGALSYSSPIVVNGWLYCGSDDGKLYAFDL